MIDEEAEEKRRLEMLKEVFTRGLYDTRHIDHTIGMSWVNPQTLHSCFADGALPFRLQMNERFRVQVSASSTSTMRVTVIMAMTRNQ